MGVHDFCRLLLSQARAEARAGGVTVPMRITALSDGNGQYWMEADGMQGRWIAGCCSYSARATLIRAVIDRAAAAADGVMDSAREPEGRE